MYIYVFWQVKTELSMYIYMYQSKRLKITS